MEGYARLLGVPQVSLAHGSFDPPPGKGTALLFYLAFRSDWCSRDELAYLFYPDSPESTARSNLRQRLVAIRRLPYSEGLVVEATRLRWPVRTDVAAFGRAVRAKDYPVALELYGGKLLEGFALPEAPEFEAWLELQREELYGQWRELVFSYARTLEAGQPQEAAALLQALLKHDPLDEEALQAYLRAAAQAGQRSAALKVYGSFSKNLRLELELEPSSSTQQLVSLIEAGQLSAPRSAAPAPASGAAGSWPAQAISFVGRQRELAELLRLLGQEDCRLLTLLGPGGVGKTRLALRAAEAFRASCQDEAYFLPLEAVTEIAGVAMAIATSLGLEVSGQEEPLEEVVRALEDKRALLVLDNFEHLVDGATLVSALVAACPGLKLIVTSRVRLELSEEWLLQLEGLAYAKEGSSLEHALARDATQLFLQRAQQVQPGFDLSEEILPHVLRICELVQGYPLALELAAAWVRALPVAAIAQEIGQNLDFLSGSSRDLNERHRSIRAAFDHSWRLLSRKEQTVLSRLAVFQGGFQREAAGVVAGAPVAALAALVDKSLLRVSNEGRYDFHPLLYQYAEEKLVLPEAAQMRARHASYFMTLAEETRAELSRMTDGALLMRLEQEHDNLRAALRWALEASRVTALRLAAALAQFWEIHGYLREGCGWLEAALALEASAPAAVRAKALTALGRLNQLRGDPARAKSFFEAGLKLWRQLGDKLSVADALNQLGTVALLQHDYARAAARYSEGLALYRETGAQGGVAILLNNFGEVARCQGDYRKAAALYEESLPLLRAAGNTRGVALALGNLGQVMAYLGEVTKAERLLKESLSLKHGFGDEIGLSYCFAGLAAVTLDAEPKRAATLLGTAQGLLMRTGHGMDVADRADFERTHASLLTRLGEVAFMAAFQQGSIMALGEAVDYALAERAPPTP